MLLGVLDIGSNSAQLQVFEARPGAPPLPTHAVKEPTLLGESFDPDGAIKPAGVDRVVEAVNRAMNAARRLGVQQLYVFNQSFDLPLRPLNGSAYGQGVTGGRRVTLVTTSSGQA
jgi:exopolyphosphatase/guanosine-5'-triphosphate,3'-diphosphate pyrophosphatase